MSELISTLDKNAISDVDKLIAKLKEVNKEIDKANSNPIGGTGSASGNRQLIQQIDELNRKLAEQAQQIQRLTDARARSNQRTQEEITNNRLLAQNASLAAQSNSTFANSYQRLTAQQAIAARRVQDLIARGRTAEQTQRQYNRELQAAQREFDRLNSRVLSADRAVGRFNRNVGNYPQRAAAGLKDLIGAFGVVGGVAAFAAISKEIFNTTKELQSLDLAIRNVTGSQEAFGESQEFISRISEAYGIEINGLTKSYTGFLAASQNAIASGKITSQQIQDIFESVAKASGAMGLSIDQQQGAFLALQQMISKGNVQAEEIRGQLGERLPGAFGILAKSMQVTEEQLNDLLKQGKVLAADVLPAFAKELEKAYGVENLERVESLAASTTRLGNAWTNLIREISEGDSVITKFFIGTLDFLDKMLKGFADLTKSSQELRDEQLNTITQSGYQEQLKLLNDMKTEETALNTALKDRLSIYAATETISSGQTRLKQLREERNALDEILAGYEEEGKGRGNFEVLANRRNYNKSLDETNLILGQIKASQEFLNKEDEKTTKKRTELTEKELKALEKARQQQLENQYKLQRLILESEQRSFEERMNDVSLYYDQRIEAAEDVTMKEIALAELARKEGLRKAGENKTLQLIIWEEYYKDYESIIKDSNERVKKLQEDAFKEFVEYREKYEGEGLKVISTEDLASEFFKKQEEDAEKAAEAAKKLKEQTDEYLKTFTEGFFADAGLPTLFKAMNDEIAGFGENFAVTFLAITEIAQEAFAFIQQNQQAAFDQMYANLDREKEIRLQYVGDNESARAEIESQYEEKRREIRRRELQAQKEQALFNIALNTAQGITAALASVPPNVPLSIVIGAIGAAQLALVASRQIPAYKMGTDNHAGGLAIVGDGGKHEVVHQPTLGWSITPAKDTLVNLEKGSKVFPDLASSGIFNSDLPDMVQLNSQGLTVAQMDRIMAKYHAAQAPYINIDKNGINTYTRGLLSKTQKLDNIVKFQGRKK